VTNTATADLPPDTQAFAATPANRWFSRHARHRWQHRGEFVELAAAVVAALEGAGYKVSVIMADPAPATHHPPPERDKKSGGCPRALGLTATIGAGAANDHGAVESAAD
jgi:hypothetical protein